MLSELIVEHNYCCNSLYALNHLVKYKIGIGYFALVPILNILLFIVAQRSTNEYIRFAYLTVLISLITFAITISIECSAVSSAVHYSRGALYTNISRNKISVSLKFKIRNIMERLSKSNIAFSVFDFFPMTQFEVYFFYTQIFAFSLLIYRLYDFKF